MKATTIIKGLHGDINKILVLRDIKTSKTIYKKYLVDVTRNELVKLKAYEFEGCINCVGNNIEVWVSKA